MGVADRAVRGGLPPRDRRRRGRARSAAAVRASSARRGARHDIGDLRRRPAAPPARLHRPGLERGGGTESMAETVRDDGGPPMRSSGGDVAAVPALLLTRRTVRFYKPDPVSDELV